MNNHSNLSWTAAFFACVMLVMALLAQFFPVDFETVAKVCTLGVFGGCLSAMLRSFQFFAPNWSFGASEVA